MRMEKGDINRRIFVFLSFYGRNPDFLLEKNSEALDSFLTIF